MSSLHPIGEPYRFGKLTLKEGTEWERVNQLLKDILNAMNALPRKTLPKGTKFRDTYEIASTIEKFLKEAE